MLYFFQILIFEFLGSRIFKESGFYVRRKFTLLYSLLQGKEFDFDFIGILSDHRLCIFNWDEEVDAEIEWNDLTIVKYRSRVAKGNNN